MVTSSLSIQTNAATHGLGPVSSPQPDSDSTIVTASGDPILAPKIVVDTTLPVQCTPRTKVQSSKLHNYTCSTVWHSLSYSSSSGGTTQNG